MKIALVSCEDLPDWEVDDQPLFKAFTDLGVDVVRPAWTETIDWGSFDACLLRTTWDYTHHLNEFLKWVDRVSVITRLFNGPDIIRWNADKRYLKQLSEQRVPIAPTIWLEEERDIAALLKQQGWTRAFLKPIVGACAQDTLRFTVEQVDQAQDLLRSVLPQSGMMLQPYLQRVETEGEFSTLYFDGRLSHAVQKIPVLGDYRVQDDFGASDKAIEVPDGLRALSELVLSKIPAGWLYARVDALRTDEKTWVLNELEMIEPSLFLRHSPTAAAMLAQATIGRLEAVQ